MKIMKNFWKNSRFILTLFLIAIIAVIVSGCVLMPDLFYDQWIWKYYWGPVMADASGHSVSWNGVYAHQGYTFISELTYGIILVFALYYIYKLIKKLKINIDWRFCLALMPYIIFGPVTRVLEDADYFSEPFVYWFISPLIYVQIAVYAVIFLIVGYYVEKRYRKYKLTTNTVLFSGGLLFLIPSLWILFLHGLESEKLHIGAFLLVISLISLIIITVYIFAYKFKYNEKLVIYKKPLNLAMLFGHLLDGITSYVSIKDPLNMGLYYSEKHPASNFLLDVWGPLFPIVKFLLIITIIYVFDILYKEELKNRTALANLIKIGIFILGFSPGLRDLLRTTIGV